MKHNYKFAKLNEDGGIEFAPLPLIIDGVNVWTNIETEYNKLGFYKITRTAMPEKEGYYFTDFWELSENKIFQRWEEHQYPKTDGVSSLKADEANQ